MRTAGTTGIKTFYLAGNVSGVKGTGREDMKAAIADKSLILPLEISVARQMINAWYGDGADKDLVGDQSW